MKILRYILFPIVPIYFLVTWLRNKLYDFGIFKSIEFDVPTICVGNLTVGGTGKTPMIEYLIRLLKNDHKVATLSRGYKRSTKGFIIADEHSTASTVGDEPFQFYKKFQNVIVSVDSDRRNGIRQLMALKNPPSVILLDDAFQHRKVKSKLNILLTPYDDLYTNDIVLPTGNLREPISGAKRTQAIVVTKCPTSISENEKVKILNSLYPEPEQQVFFSWIYYADSIKNEKGSLDMEFLSNKNITLVTGIANPKPLLKYLESKDLRFEHLKFGDHHEFSLKEIEELKTKEYILTTEKDFMRLSPYFKGSNNIFYLPIELKIDRPEEFKNIINRVFKKKMQCLD